MLIQNRSEMIMSPFLSWGWNRLARRHDECIYLSIRGNQNGWKGAWYLLKNDTAL